MLGCLFLVAAPSACARVRLCLCVHDCTQVSMMLRLRAPAFAYTSVWNMKRV